MSFFKVESGTATPNFLDSAVGVVCKTRQIPQSMGVEDGNGKTVFAGTVFPADDATAVGIVFQDVDVTDGDAIGAVMVAGRVLRERVTVSDEAVAAMTGAILFIDEEGANINQPDGDGGEDATLEGVSVDLVD